MELVFFVYVMMLNQQHRPDPSGAGVGLSCQRILGVVHRVEMVLCSRYKNSHANKMCQISDM
jgi:hypothetical protein